MPPGLLGHEIHSETINSLDVSVELSERGLGSSQGHSLPSQDSTAQKMRTHSHASSGIRTHGPSV